jgi:tetratricopeptide (TPR) repeat protein
MQGFVWICVPFSGEWSLPRMPIKPGRAPHPGNLNAIAGVLQKAMSLHKHGDIAAAARGYQQILSLAPNRFDATHLLAVVTAQLGNRDRARDLFASALALHPGHAEVHFNKGTIEKAAGRLAAAVADFGRALETAPDHLGALNNRSLTLLEMQLFDEALSDSDRLIDLVSGNPAVWNNRAILFHDMMRLDESLACFTKAIRLKPDYVEALNNRGNVLKDLHRFDEAVADYDSAITIDADFPGAHFNKSIALLLGDYETGGRLWEWRWDQVRLTSPKRNFKQPLWLWRQRYSRQDNPPSQRAGAWRHHPVHSICAHGVRSWCQNCGRGSGVPASPSCGAPGHRPACWQGRNASAF